MCINYFVAHVVWKKGCQLIDVNNKMNVTTMNNIDD